MLIKLDDLVTKYNVQFTGVLHVGAHECEEINYYEKYISRDKILWIDALTDKVEFCKNKFPNLLIEEAVISDKIETVTFNRANNGQSSSFLQLGIHLLHHPHIHYTNVIEKETQILSNIIEKYDKNINFNFLTMDIQGVELKALKGMGNYLNNIDYIYTEVNLDYVYKDCALISEIDDFLSKYNFIRVETHWCMDYQWGDAFYIKKYNILAI